MSGPVSGRTLVAGVGNVFLRDDAFGVEVIKLLSGRPVPDGVQVKDFGIRGVHLAYDLLDGCELFVLVDAAQRGEAPGTVTVLEVEVPEPDPAAGPVIDAHSLTPDGIFALLGSLGGRPGRSLLVACEPADVSAGMGLSGPVQEALPHAVRTVEEIIAGREQCRPEHGKEVLGMLSRLVTVAIIAVVLVIVIDSLPDIKRYLEIRDMLGTGHR